MPEKTEELLASAQAAHAAGRSFEAEQIARRILEAEPKHIQANLLLGVLAGKSGRSKPAIVHLEAVVDQDPESFEALFWLSLLHRREGKLVEATAFGERALKVRPDDPFSNNNIGLCYLDQIQLEKAATAFYRAASLRPDMPSIFHNLGTVYYMLGRDMEAAMALDRALKLSPNSLDSWLALGQVMISQTNPDAAEVCGRKAISMHPESAPAQLLLASALVENNKTAEAEKHMKRAVRIDPNEFYAQALLGQRYQTIGKFTEANEHLQKSLEIEPRQGFAYFAYVHNNKVTEKDRPFVERMEALIAHGGLPPRDVQFLEYGLGRAYESLGEYEKAMKHFDEANRVSRRLKFGDAVFDRVDYSNGFDWLIKTFSREFIDKNRPKGLTSDVPIIIVGMMRSGTTLAEQILSSHPQIGAAGEQRFWPSSKPTMFGPEGRAFSVERLPEFGTRYLSALRAVAPDTSHVTDKMPANYELLGPIHLALPNARIIHMRRHPVDTCVSIYATPNRVPIAYAYDRENIVFAYEEYLRLMEHWRSVLPSDRFIEVNYEDVVADRETQTRRILNLIGLEWDDAVMHHESNERNVNTPSLWQVRQPIYTTSVERWRRYEPWLGAFRKLLRDPH